MVSGKKRGLAILHKGVRHNERQSVTLNQQILMSTKYEVLSWVTAVTIADAFKKRPPGAPWHLHK